MTSKPLRIIQVSDTHLFADQHQSLLGINTQASFEAVVDLMQKEKGKIDFILHTGDIAQDGSEAAYLRVEKSLKAFGVPVYCMPGNHDHVETMERVYHKAQMSMAHKHVVLGKWQLIILNSQIPGKVAGHLDAPEIEFLQKCLKSEKNRHAIILFHHQPLPVGSKWLDNLGLQNADEFWQVTLNYPQVKAVIFGHVHQEFEQFFHDISCYAPPATCFQFKRHQDYFGIEKLPPGYRWFHLYDDGRIETGVSRVAEYVGFFDANAKGY